MKLITEQLFQVKTLVEKKEDSKDVFIEGVFMQAETPNKNGRIYPGSILENEVSKYVENYVKTNRALGELNHPASPSVDPANASHLITSLVKEGNNFIGKAKILNTPAGKIVKGLLEGGVQLGVSSRGMGSLRTLENGINEVQDDFMLSTVDIVHDPSAPDAFVNGIMEGVEWVYENGVLKANEIEAIRKDVEKTSEANRQEAKIKAFEHFMNKLSTKK